VEGERSIYREERKKFLVATEEGADRCYIAGNKKRKGSFSRGGEGIVSIRSIKLSKKGEVFVVVFFRKKKGINRGLVLGRGGEKGKKNLPPKEKEER